MPWSPVLTRSVDAAHLPTITLGHPRIDEYLAFAGARLRLNSWLAVAFDLKVLFSIVRTEPAAVTTADVFTFIKAQRAPRRGPTVVRLEDGEAGLSARTIKRRLASVSACGYATSRRVSSGCSSWRARVAINAACPSRSGSSSPWPSTWRTSGQLPHGFRVPTEDQAAAPPIALSADVRSARARMPSSILRSITKCGTSMSAV